MRPLALLPRARRGVALLVAAGALSAGALALFAMPRPAGADGENLGAEVARRLAGARAVDLAWPISATSPHWPEAKEPAFRIEPLATFESGGYFAQTFAMPEHFGTHVDAPAHFERGGATVDKLAPERLCGEAFVLGPPKGTAADPDWMLSRAGIASFESSHGGPIPAGAIVLLRTGWGARALDQDAYRNKDDRGRMHFPGFSPDAVMCLAERGVRGIGVDTLSIDRGMSTTFEAHHIFAQAGMWAVENLSSSLAELPERGAFVSVLPIPLAGGSGAPARVIAFVPSASRTR